MQNNWKYVFTTIVVIFVFASSATNCVGRTFVKMENNLSLKSNIISNRNYLYVGGNGPGNYTKIQDAIDNASNWDDIFVYNGTYFGSIEIYKILNLTGEDKNRTFIDGNGNGDVVYISEDWVNISGFTIQNSGSNVGNSGVDIRSDHNTIENNIIAYNKHDGIFNYGFSNNTIINNSIISNIGYGISFSEADNNFIMYNNITLNTRDGIYIDLGDGNLIFRNEISFNNVGIALWDSHNYVSNNKIFKNSLYGIDIRYNFNSFIFNNIISHNDVGGIGITESNENTILGNTVTQNFGHGVFLDISSSNNITGNTISYNNEGIGLFPDFDSNNNLIYHNNFLNNIPNAFDEFENTWYSLEIGEGNFWSDYNGKDEDENGIGDTPYNISGGSNQDLYPLMKPYGSPIADFIYYANNRTFDGSLSYDNNGYIVIYEWDFGDGSTGQGEVITHVYNESGKFNVTLTVTDNDGYHGNITKIVEVEANYEPKAPLINGKLKGRRGKEYSYTFVSEDPNGDDVFYNIDWGDGNVSIWLGPFPSDEQIIINHSWAEKGTYIIMARAKDIYGAIGDWGTLEIKMPKENLFYFNSYILSWLIEYFTYRFPILKNLFGYY
jgi:parallel beta-helix repeat protein